jgi:hypothetical protein
MLDQKKTSGTIEFNVGNDAPYNEKASNSIDQDLCFVCGRKLGKNAYHFEVNTSWQIIELGGSNSQGCFPVGSECAKKFAAGLLVKVGA